MSDFVELVCRRCGKPKLVGLFAPSHVKRDRPWCIECVKLYVAGTKIKNPVPSLETWHGEAVTMRRGKLIPIFKRKPPSDTPSH